MDSDFAPIDTYRKTVFKATCCYCGKLFPPRGIASHERWHKNEMEKEEQERLWRYDSEQAQTKTSASGSSKTTKSERTRKKSLGTQYIVFVTQILIFHAIAADQDERAMKRARRRYAALDPLPTPGKHNWHPLVTCALNRAFFIFRGSREGARSVSSNALPP